MIQIRDNKGKVSKSQAKVTRVLSRFMASVINYYGKKYPDDEHQVRCFKDKCQGVLVIRRSLLTDKLRWNCTECRVEGIISNWRVTEGEDDKNSIAAAHIDPLAVARVQRLITNLRFPIKAEIQDFIKEDYPDTNQVVMYRIHDFLEIDGLVVEAHSEQQGYLIPLVNLFITDEGSTNFKLVEEFLKWWFSNRPKT